MQAQKPLLDLAAHTRLVAALRQRLARECRSEIGLIETHISSVLLTPTIALKLKKPVALGFADFTTLAARRHCCEEELRLNRRTAPRLYLGVVPVRGTVAAPTLRNDGAPIDFAVRMRRFDNDDLLDRRARAARLTPQQVDRLAGAIAALHAEAAVATPRAGYGTPARVHDWARENFGALQALAGEPDAAASLQYLASWTEGEFARIAAAVTARLEQGFVRECHGDLHLGNAVLIDDEPVLFDAIDFNPQLRFIDVISDIAFTFMDLLDHGRPVLAWRLLNAYLEITGDYAGLEVLRFYAVYRALVRAKVAVIRAGQAAGAAADHECRRLARHYVQLARRLTEPDRPAWWWVGGLSGSGKTTVAGLLVEQAQAIRVRADVERKRLHGLRPTQRPAPEQVASLYGMAANTRTYARLRQLARSIGAAGYTPVVDAAFLRAAERAVLAAEARAAGATLRGIWCTADAALMGERVTRRLQGPADASDADAAVLQRQLADHEAPVPGEEVIRLDTGCDLATLSERVAALAAAAQDQR